MTENQLIRFCAPTLAGLKSANMFTSEYRSQAELEREIKNIDNRLSGRGVRVITLYRRTRRALIYVYRPIRLMRDLSEPEAVKLLCDRGYNCRELGEYLERLALRLAAEDEFPHEIGLFLGYPARDVLGFIENRAKNFKFVGGWKVYGDEERAALLFMRYKKCTELFVKRYADGSPIERLTVMI